MVFKLKNCYTIEWTANATHWSNICVHHIGPAYTIYFVISVKYATFRPMKLCDSERICMYLLTDYMKAKNKQNLKNLWEDSLNPSTTWWKANIKLPFCCRLVCAWMKKWLWLELFVCWLVFNMNLVSEGFGLFEVLWLFHFVFSILNWGRDTFRLKPRLKRLVEDKFCGYSEWKKQKRTKMQMLQSFKGSNEVRLPMRVYNSFISSE